MEQYVKVIDGKMVLKERNKIVITESGRQYINPPHDVLMAHGWMPFQKEENRRTPYKNKVEKRRDEVKKEILRYDSSQDVNSFYMGENLLWLDKSTRVGLMLRFDAERAAGKTETTLWSGGSSYTLGLSEAEKMLMAIELYASACYDNTQLHLSNIAKINSIPKLDSYDYTLGYPDKLRF